MVTAGSHSRGSPDEMDTFGPFRRTSAIPSLSVDHTPRAAPTVRGSAAATIASPGRGTPTTCWAHVSPQRPTVVDRGARGGAGRRRRRRRSRPRCAHRRRRAATPNVVRVTSIARRRLAVDDALQQLGVPRHLVVAARRAAERTPAGRRRRQHPGVQRRRRPPAGGREVGVAGLGREPATGPVGEHEVVVGDDEAAAVARVGVGVHDDDDVAVDGRPPLTIDVPDGSASVVAAAGRSRAQHPPVRGGRIVAGPRGARRRRAATGRGSAPASPTAVRPAMRAVGARRPLGAWRRRGRRASARRRGRRRWRRSRRPTGPARKSSPTLDEARRAPPARPGRRTRSPARDRLAVREVDGAVRVPPAQQLAAGHA